jgi:NAD(P)H-flavin reductase
MNLYQPHLMKIREIIDETPDTRTLSLSFQDQQVSDSFDFLAGQFGEYSVFGSGECTFCIASSPTRKGSIECTFKSVGKATRALRGLNPGDTMGFRGPYGNHFPLEQMEKANLVFIAGGIGLAPVRCVIWNALDLRDRFDQVTIVYGARSVSDPGKRDREAKRLTSSCRLWTLAVRPRGKGRSASPTIVEKAAPSSKNAYAVICGPPIMISSRRCSRSSVSPDHVHHAREPNEVLRQCGRCNVGPVYVQGRRSSAAQIAALPPEY